MCKEVCLDKGVSLKAKRFIIGVAVKNRTVQFRLNTGEDVFLLNKESLNDLRKPKLSDVIGRLRNASKRLTKFKGFHIIARGHVLWHENTGVIPCKVWCRYLLGMDLVRKTGLSDVCGTFLKRVWAEQGKL